MIYPEFPNYSAFSIDNHPGSGYQAKITIAWKPGMRTDFRDIRFHDNLERKIPYWVESKTNGSTAVVWIKLTSSKIVTLRWGNPAARSESDGNAVFLFFDDFENGVSAWTLEGGTFTKDTSVFYSGAASGKFTQSSSGDPGFYKLLQSELTNCVLEYNVRAAQTNRTTMVLSLWDDVAYDGWDGLEIVMTNDGRWGVYTNRSLYYGNYSANTWYKLKIVVKGVEQWDFYINDVLKASNLIAEGSPKAFDRLYAGYYNYGSFFYDNIFLRKYAATEPTFTYITSGYVPQIERLSSLERTLLNKEFASSNDILLSKQFIDSNNVLVSKTFSSDSDIHLLKAFYSGSDIQVWKIYSQNNRILIKNEFSSANDIIFSLLKIYSSTSDIHLLKSFYSGSDIRIQKHFYSGSDIRVGKAFSSESDILILLSKMFSNTSDIRVLRVFAGSSDIHLSKIFSSSNDIILIAESGEFDHPLTVIIFQVDRGIIISQILRTVYISQIERTVTISQ
jgi:hypothetical protein